MKYQELCFQHGCSCNVADVRVQCHAAAEAGLYPHETHAQWNKIYTLSGSGRAKILINKDHEQNFLFI